MHLRRFPVLALLAITPWAHADWPQFLGPNRDGQSTEKGLNLDWSATPPTITWKVQLGAGFGSMAVIGHRVYTLAQRRNRDYVVAVDTTNGKELWSLDAAPGYLDTWERQGPGPRATPTFEKGKLYCQMSNGDLLCVQADDGREVWRTNVFTAANTRDRTGDAYYWGLSASPLIEGNLLIVQPGGKDEGSVLALHKETGKVAWKLGSEPMGYGSPIAITLQGQRMVVVTTGQSVVGIEPKKGTLLWRYAIGNRFNANCATPVYAEGLLFLSAAYGTGAAALELTFSEGRWTVRERWRNKEMQNIFGTSIVREGHLYGSHGGFEPVTLRCLEANTGMVRWNERMNGRQSLIAVEGHLICVGERGTVRLVEARPDKYRLKGELKDLLEFKAWAGPALHEGKLYLRDQKHLICVDLRKK